MADKKNNCGCGCIGQKQTPQKKTKAAKAKTRPKKSKQVVLFPGGQDRAEDEGAHLRPIFFNRQREYGSDYLSGAFAMRPLMFGYAICPHLWGK